MRRAVLNDRPDVGRVGIGTWPLGGVLLVGDHSIGRGDLTDSEAVALISRAIASGHDFIDTADLYGDGRSETIIGEVIRTHRLSPTICTKFGNRIMGAQVVQDFSTQWLATAVDASLTRLQVNRLDILLLHSPADDFDWHTYDRHPFDRLIHDGKIGCYGVSCRSLRGAKNVLTAKFGSVIEVIYNVVDRRAEEEILPLAQMLQVKVIARCPLAYGLLVSTPERTFLAGDHRRDIDPTTRRWIYEAKSDLAFLEDLPGGFAVSALRFCLTDARVDVVIPGLQRQAHLDAASMAAKLGPLPSEITRMIRSAVPETYAGWQRPDKKRGEDERVGDFKIRH